IVEDALYAISVMGIVVDIQYPGIVRLPDPGDGRRQIVIDAEARSAVAMAMVQSAGHIEGPANRSRHHHLSALNRPADHRAGRLMHPGEDGVVIGSQSPGPSLGYVHIRGAPQALHGGDEIRIVHPEQFLLSGWTGFHHLDLRRGEQPHLLDQRDGEFQPLRIERVIRFEAVGDEPWIPDQSGARAHAGIVACRSFSSDGQPTSKPAERSAFSATRGSIVATFRIAVRGSPIPAAGTSMLTMFNLSSSLMIRMARATSPGRSATRTSRREHPWLAPSRCTKA